MSKIQKLVDEWNSLIPSYQIQDFQIQHPQKAFLVYALTAYLNELHIDPAALVSNMVHSTFQFICSIYLISQISDNTNEKSRGPEQYESSFSLAHRSLLSACQGQVLLYGFNKTKYYIPVWHPLF